MPTNQTTNKLSKQSMNYIIKQINLKEEGNSSLCLHQEEIKSTISSS